MQEYIKSKDIKAFAEKLMSINWFRKGENELANKQVIKLAVSLGGRCKYKYGFHAYPVCKIVKEQCWSGIEPWQSAENCAQCSAENNLRYYEIQQYICNSWNIVYLRDGMICEYCGIDGLENENNYANVTVDHLVPRQIPTKRWIWDNANWWKSILIANSPFNLVCSCRSCNSQKSNRTDIEPSWDIMNPEEWSLETSLTWVKSWFSASVERRTPDKSPETILSNIVSYESRKREM